MDSKTTSSRTRYPYRAQHDHSTSKTDSMSTSDTTRFRCSTRDCKTSDMDSEATISRARYPCREHYDQRTSEMDSEATSSRARYHHDHKTNKTDSKSTIGQARYPSCPQFDCKTSEIASEPTSSKIRYPVTSDVEEHFDSMASFLRLGQRFVEDAFFYRQRYLPRDVPPGSNSLFAAVVDQLRIKGDFSYNPQILRSSAVRYLRQHPVQEDGTPLSSYVVDESWGNYLRRMSLDTEYGDQIILGAIADVVQMPVIVISGFSEPNRTVITPNRWQPEGQRNPLSAGESEGDLQDPSETEKDATTREDGVLLGQLDGINYISLRTKDWKTQLDKGLRSLSRSDEKTLFPIHYINFLMKYIFHSNLIHEKECEVDQTDLQTKAPRGTTVESIGPASERLLSSISQSASDTAAMDDTQFSLSVLVVPNDTKVHTSFCAGEYLVMGRRYFDLAMHHCSSPVGFVKLKARNASSWKSALYFDEENLHFVRHLNLINRDDLITTSFLYGDVMLGLRSFWPPDAIEWETRDRPSGWPSQDTVSQITANTCRVVPEASEDSEYPNTEWRFNFGVAMRVLSDNHLTAAQMSCFRCLHQLLDNRTKEHRDHVYTVLQHTFFYACEQVEAKEWEKEPGTCLIKILKTLNEHLLEKRVPHYFMENVNLVEFLPPRMVEDLLEALSSIKNNPVLSLYFLFDGNGYTSPSSLGKLLDSMVEDAERFSLHRKLDRTFLDFIFPEFIKLAQACLLAPNYGRAKSVFQEILEMTEEQGVISEKEENLEQKIFMKINDKVPSMTAWCFAFYLSETIHINQNVFDAVCEGLPTHPISEVFGSDLLYYIFTNEVNIPKSFTEGSEMLYFLYRLVRILQDLGRRRAIVSMVQHCLCTNDVYISELSGISQPIKRVGDKALEMDLLYLSSALYSYSTALSYLGQKELILEYMEIYEGLADRMGQPTIYFQIGSVWQALGFQERAIEAFAKIN